MLSIFGSASAANIHTAPTAEASLFAGAAVDPSTGKMLDLPALLKGSEGAAWNTANANEIGRLAQGVGQRMPTGSNTIFFIPHDKKSANKKATYVRIVCAD